VRWLRRAAEASDATAQYNLGCMYARGEGVDIDKGEATKWYHLAAEQGLAMAQHNLGLIYFESGGHQQDYKTAFEWFLKAAEQGYAPSQVIAPHCTTLERALQRAKQKRQSSTAWLRTRETPMLNFLSGKCTVKARGFARTMRKQ
jgi:TPR repeat protein